MTNVLDGLGLESGNPPQTAPTPADDATARPLLVLRAIANGQIPGVVVPKTAPAIPSDLTPDDIAGAGVGIYKPHTTDLATVLFNQQQVSVEELQHLDKSGKLSEALPSITSFLGDTTAPEVTPDAPAAPSDAGPVPVMPRPGMSGEANTAAATSRMKQLGDTEPSKRMLPGGGKILNGLLQRTV